MHCMKWAKKKRQKNNVSSSSRYARGMITLTSFFTYRYLWGTTCELNEAGNWWCVWLNSFFNFSDFYYVWYLGAYCGLLWNYFVLSFGEIEKFVVVEIKKFLILKNWFGDMDYGHDCFWALKNYENPHESVHLVDIIVVCLTC